MNRQELLDELVRIAEASGDPEVDHVRADNALLAYINSDKITKAFNAIEKWYA